MRKNHTFVISLLIVILFISCDGKQKANKSIDQVSPELIKSVKQYSEIMPFHDGLAAVKNDSKWGYIDKLGQLIIDCQYDEAESFECNRAIVHTNEMEGCIDSEGNDIIELKYESLSFDEHDSTFIARLNGKVGVLDYNGKIIIPFDFKSIGPCSEGMRGAQKGNKWGYVNSKGEETIPYIFDQFSNFSAHAQ